MINRLSAGPKGTWSKYGNSAEQVHIGRRLNAKVATNLGSPEKNGLLRARIDHRHSLLTIDRTRHRAKTA